MTFRVSSIEQQNLKQPFEFALPDELGGHTFTMANPRSMDWRDVVNIDTMSGDEAISALLGTEQYERFVAVAGVNLGMIEEIMNGWRDHFGLGEAGEARGLPALSNGTAPR